MSKEVEQRVVEMRFDNKQFESATATTMSTLDKLKQKLNFTGASKGFEDINNAAKKVDMNPLAKAVDTVSVKFSNLQVMGVTALANITNSAVNAGKRIVSALTIDPVKTGFQEYETQINAIQTILANTQSKGTTLGDVTAALDELNKYADQTIYNFTEMTKNIGTFTAAGVDLEKSVTSIKGIANLAAVSGSNAQQASTAMYQLSQALAAGKVSLMDWNSVVNAGMGGELFQNALKRTAKNFGKDVDGMIEKYGSFRESLTKGEWLTAEVLTETLTQLSGAYTEADLLAQGYTKQQAKDIVDLANTAVSAATDVKTFTQLIDTLKESIQSGWTQTWELLFGDFEEAKTFFTGLSNTIGGIVQRSADARNSLLEGALSSNWDRLTKQINGAGVATEEFSKELEATIKANGGNVDKLVKKYGSLEKALSAGAISSDLITETLKRMGGVTSDVTGSTKDLTAKLEYFQKVVDEVWKGNYANGAERIEALTKAGYNYAEVQALVNKTVDGHRLTLEDLNETQLVSIGYSKEEAKAIAELAKQAEEAGTPLNKIIEDIAKPSGRDLLIDSLNNSLKSLISISEAVGKAWRNAFPPMTSDQLYNIIEGIHAFTESIIPSADTLDKLTRSLQGLFAILDIVTTILGGGLKLGLRVASELLGTVGLSVLDVTAYLGDLLVKFRDFLLNNELVNTSIELLATGIMTLITGIGDLIDAFLDLPVVQSAIDGVITALSDLADIGKWAIEGLQNGLSTGLTSIPQILANIGVSLLNAIKNVLGIHSPSTEMYDVGVNAMEGFIGGIESLVSVLLDSVKQIGSNVIDFFGSIDWSKVFAVAATTGLFYMSKRMIDIIDAFSAPFEGVGAVLTSVSNIIEQSSKQVINVIKGVFKVLNAKAFEMRAGAIKTLAVSLAILAGSLFLISKIDSDRLWESIGAMAALAGIISLLSIAVSKFGATGSLKFVGVGLGLQGMALSLILIAASMKILETIDAEKMTQTLGGFVAMVIAMSGMLALLGKVANGPGGKDISKLGGMMLKLSLAMLLMVGVMKLVSSLAPKEIIVGGLAIGAFLTAVALLAKFTSNTSKDISKLGGTMIKLGIAMLLMVGVIKLISGMSAGELIKGGLAITAFVGIVGLLVKITQIGKDKDIAKLGGTLLGISASMLLMVGVIKLISGLDAGEIIKGVAAILAFSGIIALLVNIVKLAGPEVPKIAGTLLAMSASMAILAGVAILLSLIDIAGLAKGVVAIGILTAFMAGLVYVTKYAQDVKGDLVVMTVAIGLIAAAIAGLSFIEPSRLAGASIALSMVMGMFALVIKSTAAVKSSLPTLIVMTLAVTMLGGIIYLLAGLPADSAIAASASLSILLLSLAASIKILDSIKKISLSAVGAIGIMMATIVGLALILKLISDLDVEPSLDTVITLSAFLLAMSGVTLVLSAIGPMAKAASAGAIAMAKVIGIIALVVAAAGAIAQIPGAQWLVSEGGDFLQAIGMAIGQFIGGIAGGLALGATSVLPEVGQNLSDFMTNASAFINGAKSFDSSAMDGVKALAETVMMLTSANILDGIVSFFTGKSSLAAFAEELVPFGHAMNAFSASLSGMDSNLVANAATAGKALAEMAATIPNSGGLVSFFAGENDMGLFGSQLTDFGAAMKSFGESVAGMDANAVTNAATAGKALAEMAATVPNSGGLVAFFAGENDMGEFAKQLIPFGKAMKDYSLAVSGMDTDAITNSITVGRSLIELANAIPNTGGLVSFFAGENDMGLFGSQLISFGKSMKDYATSVAGIDSGAIDNSIMAGKALIELSKTIPNTGGLITMFTGDNSMSVFGSQLVSFGQSFKMYSDYMKEVDADVLANTTNAANSLVKLANSLPENKLFTRETWLDEFGMQLSEFGRYFANYYNEISLIDSSRLSAVITEVGHIVEMANSIVGVDTSKMTSFGKALTNLGNTGVDGFVAAFENSSGRVQKAVTTMLQTFIVGANAKSIELKTAFRTILDEVLKAITSQNSDFRKAGETVVVNFGDGAYSKRSEVAKSFKNISDESVTVIRDQRGSFHDAGIYVVEGFVEGISTSSWEAVSQVRQLATTITNTMNQALGINSPSRVFYGIGNYVVQGLSLGIKDYTSTAAKSAIALGASVLNSIQTYLGINSPSTVMRDQVGRYIVQGVAEGIANDMSAEEAAAQKAKNIVNAFQSVFDEIDSLSSRSKLEYDLWGKMNISASDLDKNLAESDYLKREIDYQTERVQNANAEYQATLMQFGESSEYTRSAYNKLLQEQINLADLANQLNTLQQSLVEQNKQAFMNYTTWVNENKETLLSLGYTLDEIQAAGMNRTGYNPDATGEFAQTDVKQIVANAMKDVEVAFEDNIGSTITKVTAESTNVGKTMAAAIGTGIQNGAPKATENVTAMVTTCSETIKSHQPDWVTAGSYLVDGFIEGIESNIERAAQTAARMAAEAYNAAMAELGLPGSDGMNTLLDLFGPPGSGAIAAVNPEKYSEPVIKPVLDLSEVESGVDTINTMMSRDLAVSIDTRMSRAANESLNEQTTTGASTSYSFVQNNYSPKALSRVEIYRQTKNQLTTLERMAKK